MLVKSGILLYNYYVVLVRPEVDMMKYEKIYAPTVTEIFESRIQQSILSGELQAGERLPAERILAEEMGISKSAVHLGMSNLAKSGFIRIDPRQGAYVANWEESGDLNTLTALLKTNVLKLDPQDIRSLILMREALESEAMKKFVLNCTTADILQLRTLAHELRNSVHMNPPMNTVDQAELAFRFSHFIFLHSGNMFSTLVLNSFKPFTLRLWEEWIRSIGANAASDYLEQTALALKNRDALKAIAIVHKYNEDLLVRLENSEKV